MVPCIDDSGIDDRNGVDSYINTSLPNLIRSSTSTQALMNHHHRQSHSSSRSDHVWLKIQQEASLGEKQEPILSQFFRSTILSFDSLECALANLLAVKLCNSCLSKETLYGEFLRALQETDEIQGKFGTDREERDRAYSSFDGICDAIGADLRASKERDPACLSYLHCFLNFKGFLACQAYRISHRLWLLSRTALALIIQGRVSEVFGVDIHPGAKIGKGIVIDHATGVVIGETCVVGDNVTIFHDVTLGGRGEETRTGGTGELGAAYRGVLPKVSSRRGFIWQDGGLMDGEEINNQRHPKIGDGVMIGAGAKVLGNIRIGNGAKIGAASVVLKDVPPFATAVGNPARLLHQTRKKNRS